MDKVLLILAGLTAVGYGFFAFARPVVFSEGLESSTQLILQALPWIIVSMFAAGLLAQFIEPKTVASWLGREAGLQGIIIGASLGLLGTGSRWAVYPLAAGLLAANAGAGSVFAFITSWQLVSVTRLPAEVPFFGLKFTVIRAAVSLFVAVLGGVMVDLLNQKSVH